MASSSSPSTLSVASGDHDDARLAQDLLLDEAKLSSGGDQADVLLLQWLAKVEVALTRIQDDSIVAKAQPKLLETFMRIITPHSTAASSPTTSTPPPSSPTQPQWPRPGRPARHLLARVYLLLLKRGDSRALYDLGQTLLRVAGDDGKVSKITYDRESKTAALYVLGEVFGQLGQQVMSLFVDIVTTTQRIFKPTAAPVIVRYHALVCLNKAILCGGKSLSDVAAKEVVKSLRSGLGDKAGAVVRGCADCLLSLCESTNFIANRADIEAILAAAFKDIETIDYVTRRAVARMSASLLASTQRANSAPPPPAPSKSKKKKGGKRGDDGGEDSEEEEANAAAAAAAASAGPEGAMLSPQAMLDLIAQPFYRAASRRARVALLDVYATTFTTLGIAWVQTNYAVVLRHLIDDLPARSTASRSDVLTLRAGVNLILRRVIGERMLGEQGQVSAVQEICNSYLKRYPVVMPGQPPPPSKYTLVLGLSEVAGLLHQLGTAPHQVLDALYDPLLRCLAHPSHSVQISAAWCLRTLCHIHPTQFSKTIATLVELLNKDLQTLNGAGERGGAEVSKRAIGHSRGLAAVLSVIPSRPLYTSFEVGSQVMDLASGLLKSCGDHSWSIAGVEIQVAWTLLSALMSLGPNFVRPHLDHLALLWRNALPRPNGSNGSQRSEAEWALMLHLRESALSCILAFLNHNSAVLLNLDLARRLVALLSNTLAFVDGFASQHPGLAQEHVPGAERSQLTLLDREHLLRRRLFQCFAAMATNAAMEPLQDSLVSVALQTFAEPDRYIGSTAQAAIAASAGSFTTLWAMSDSYAFGVSSLQRDDETFIVTGESDLSPQSSLDRRSRTYPATETTTRTNLLNRDSVEVQIDALSRRPVLGAAEHDPLVLFSRYDAPTDTAPLPPPPATAMVDAALALFAALLPFQKRQIQVAAFETMLSYCRSAKLERNPGRRAAIQINSCVASLGALRMAMSGATGIGGVKAAGFNNDRLTTALREVLKDALLYGDGVLRSVSSQTYGRLAAVAGSHAMSSQVQFLVDQVVSNRDPDARAGCALAFGAVYSEVGGLSAGPLTKTVVNVLMSLSSDPHPTVHYSALQALRLVIDAASLSYAPYVSSTLGMLVKLSMLDTHEAEGGSAGSVNLRADLPAHQMICRVIAGLIGVLGPDLQESGKVRNLIHVLLDEMARERDDDGVVVEAAKARQQFCLFVAAEQMDLPQWVAQLTENLRNRKRPRKLAAVNGLYQLVQREALLVSKLGGDALVADLFAQLDIEPSMDGVREVLLSWLRQTAELSPISWIDLCQRIIIAQPGAQQAAKAAAKTVTPAGALQDEEAAGLGIEDDAANSVAALEGSRWRTRLFALQCLHEVFAVVRRSGHLEHFATPPSQHGERAVSQRLMSSRVADLIRMAFTASTSANDEIRLEGLVVLQDVIESFKLARDPEFEEALLLEQHQAPIAAALTPAFLADSTPEVLASAIQVCAVFVGSGVVRDVSRMGRILKQLVTALQACKTAEMRELGDVKELSPNAAAMLKVATFSAWSDLVVAGFGTQPYLLPVVEPHLDDDLVPYWVASLREYAKIKIDPDSTSAELGLGGAEGFVVVNPSLDSQWAGLAREVLLPYYQQSWAKILHALSVLMDKDHAGVFKAMDGGESTAPSAFRSEPSMSFFVLYGLVFEALAAGGSGALVYLGALRSLARPQVAGTALLQDATFNELVNLCFRLVMTESLAVQGGVINVVVGLAKAYGQRLFEGEEASGGMPRQIADFLRIVICAITRSHMQPGATKEDKASLLRSAFSALLTLADMVPASRDDVYCVAWHLYAELLRDESEATVDVVPLTLASLRDLCQRSNSNVSRSIHGLVSLALNSIDDLRGRAGKVATSKTRNCIMALTVVLTSASVPFSRPVLEQACYLVVHKMSEAGEDEVALTAANCGRTLLVAAASSEGLAYCLGQLLPGFVHIATLPAETTVQRAVVAEVLKSFAAVAQSPRLMGVVLPALLYHVGEEGGEEAVAHLLDLASRQPAAFREATSRLHADDRARLEKAIRGAIAARGGGKQQAAAAVTRGGEAGEGGSAGIALRSFA